MADNMYYHCRSTNRRFVSLGGVTVTKQSRVDYGTVQIFCSTVDLSTAKMYLSAKIYKSHADQNARSGGRQIMCHISAGGVDRFPIPLFGGPEMLAGAMNPFFRGIFLIKVPRGGHFVRFPCPGQLPEPTSVPKGGSPSNRDGEPI